MARPKRDLPPDQFTATELAVAGGMSARNFVLLQDKGLAPPGEGVGGKGGGRFWRSAGVSRIAMVGAFNKAGVELLVAARLSSLIAEEFEEIYGKVFSRLDKYLLPPLNHSKGYYPWKEEDGDHDTADDFWMHHYLLTRTNIYRKATAFKDDVKFEVVDRKYVFRLGALSTPEPWCRITEWEKGLAITHTYDEAASSTDDSARIERERLIGEEYAEAHNNAVGILRVNISIAVRNAFDAIHDYRLSN